MWEGQHLSELSNAAEYGVGKLVDEAAAREQYA